MPETGARRAYQTGGETIRDKRRGQIIAAGRKIVAREGLAALTIGALEDRLSFTRGVISYHFRNKNAIVDAVLESAIAEINAGTVARVDASGDMLAQCRGAIGGMVDGFLKHREAAAILIGFWGRSGADKQARRMNAELFRHYRGMSRVLVDSVLAERGECDVDPDGMATVMVGVVLGIVCQNWFDPDVVGVEGAVEEAAQSVYRRLKG